MTKGIDCVIRINVVVIYDTNLVKRIKIDMSKAVFFIKRE